MLVYVYLLWYCSCFVVTVLRYLVIYYFVVVGCLYCSRAGLRAIGGLNWLYAFDSLAVGYCCYYYTVVCCCLIVSLSLIVVAGCVGLWGTLCLSLWVCPIGLSGLLDFGG